VRTVAPASTLAVTWSWSVSRNRGLACGPTSVDGSDGQRLGLVDESVDERVVDVVDDDEPLGGDTRLAAVLVACPRAAFGGRLEIGVLEHDERVAPAEFEDGLFQLIAGCRRHGAAGRTTAGQRRRLDAVVGDDVVDEVRGCEHRLEDALRIPGVAEQLL